MGKKIIYKAINRDLKQVLIGCTDLPLEELPALHRKERPRAIAHWDLDRQHVEYVNAQVVLGEHDYQEFLFQYSHQTGIPGWTTLVEEQ